MGPKLPVAKRVIFIGGGHTHALVLRAIAMKPLPDILLTLINPSPKAPYTGMLPGFVSGHYTKDDVEIDLIRLARASNTQIILDEVTGLDPQTKTIELKNRAPIPFDLASINIGITGQQPTIKGFEEFGHGAKPLGTFSAGWQKYLASSVTQQNAHNIAVIGGGVAGVELALSIKYHLTTISQNPARVTILEKNAQALSGTSPKTRARLLKHIERAGISLKTHSAVVEITESAVHLADGTHVPSEFTVGAAGATPHAWIAQTGLDCHDGFVKVNANLQTLRAASIFACGDCAHFTPNPLPKAGVFAVRQAPILLKNLKAALQNKPLTAYKPQKTYLKLISTGNKSAVSDKLGPSFDGPLLWRLKDRIDRNFMNRLDDLPQMTRKSPHPEPIATPPKLREKYENLCGGCGAKMDSSQLDAVLRKLPRKKQNDIVSDIGDDAAILKHGNKFQVFTTDHLRAFSNDPWLMGQISAIHAMGDIWAMGARPQAALASIILPPMADHLHASTLNEILTAATHVINEAGAQIVGGHTSIGSELTVGFSMTGLRDTKPIQNVGAHPGDALILTKPLGVGTVLAAEMRGKADGYDVQDTYDLMCRPSQLPSEILSPVAHAMTDVTGFGLANHLLQMMINSNTAAKLDLAQIPMLESAVKYANQDIKSSLWSANRAACSDWADDDTGKASLLFDPQTVGGLLAAVPQKTAPTLIKALEDAGETARIIGEVTDNASPQIRLT